MEPYRAKQDSRARLLIGTVNVAHLQPLLSRVRAMPQTGCYYSLEHAQAVGFVRTLVRPRSNFYLGQTQTRRLNRGIAFRSPGPFGWRHQFDAAFTNCQ